MLGKRQHLRIKSGFKVRWTMAETPFQKGEAKVTNMSVSGMDVVLGKDFTASVGSVLYVEPLASEVTSLQPTKVKVVWVKNENEDIRCGLTFLKDNE